MQKRVHHTGADFKENHGNFFGWFSFCFFSFGLGGVGGGVLVFLLLGFFFNCQRSKSSLAASPSECWVSCNDPKVTGQCNMGIQFKVLSI